MDLEVMSQGFIFLMIPTALGGLLWLLKKILPEEEGNNVINH
jgi:hypothetical protein